MCRTSDLDCIIKVQVYLEQSSTRVKKYLKPVYVGVLKGPQTSHWIMSKTSLATWLLNGKASLLCLARDKYDMGYNQQGNEKNVKYSLVEIAAEMKYDLVGYAKYPN